MRFRPNFLVIPALAAAVAWTGSFFTMQGMLAAPGATSWFETLIQPAWAPPEWVFGPVWTAIFILAAIAALVIWNTFPRNQDFKALVYLFAANALVNVFWSFLFFTQQLIGAALLDAVVLEFTVLALIAVSWRYSRIVPALLAPYAAWVLFAIALNASIWTLN